MILAKSFAYHDLNRMAHMLDYFETTLKSKFEDEPWFKPSIKPMGAQEYYAFSKELFLEFKDRRHEFSKPTYVCYDNDDGGKEMVISTWVYSFDIGADIAFILCIKEETTDGDDTSFFVELSYAENGEYFLDGCHLIE